MTSDPKVESINVTVSDFDTHLYVIKATKRRRNLCLITPGNPGVGHFYIDFARELHRLSNGSDDIVVVSHVGHCGQTTGGKVYSLDDQIAHKVALVDLLSGVSEDDDASADRLLARIGLKSAHLHEPLVLLGHSIGAHINIRAVQQRPNAPVAAVVNLFPTIRNLYEGLANGVKIAILPYVRQTVAFILHYSPMWLRNWLMSFSTSMTDEAKYATVDKLSYDLVNNILHMAYTETLDVVDIHDEVKTALATPQLKYVFLYGRTDAYTPLSFVDDLRQSYPHLTNDIHLADEGVAHAFVLESSARVARHLQKVVPQFSNK